MLRTSSRAELRAEAAGDAAALRRNKTRVRGPSRMFCISDHVTICTSTKQYLVSVRLSDLEGYLAEANFLRIHRSHLINLEYVASIEPHDTARVLVVMKSWARIVASRAGSKRLRELVI